MSSLRKCDGFSRSSRTSPRAEAEVVELLAQSVAIDSQDLCCAYLIPSGSLQSHFEERAFEFFQEIRVEIDRVSLPEGIELGLCTSADGIEKGVSTGARGLARLGERKVAP